MSFVDQVKIVLPASHARRSIKPELKKGTPRPGDLFPIGPSGAWQHALPAGDGAGAGSGRHATADLSFGGGSENTGNILVRRSRCQHFLFSDLNWRVSPLLAGILIHHAGWASGRVGCRPCLLDGPINAINFRASRATLRRHSHEAILSSSPISAPTGSCRAPGPSPRKDLNSDRAAACQPENTAAKNRRATSKQHGDASAPCSIALRHRNAQTTSKRICIYLTENALAPRACQRALSAHGYRPFEAPAIPGHFLGVWGQVHWR